MGVSKYRLDITVRMVRLGDNGEWLNGQDTFAIASERVLELGNFAEIAGAIGAISQTVDELAIGAAAIAELEAKTGQRPCNCRGNGLHFHTDPAAVDELVASLGDTRGVMIVDEHGARRPADADEHERQAAEPVGATITQTAGLADGAGGFVGAINGADLP